jgi:iron complex transport system permease protein
MQGEPVTMESAEARQALRVDRVASGARLARNLTLLLGVLGLSVLIALTLGYHRVDLNSIREDPTTRVIFFQLRLPRVILGGLVGASLAVVGAALQALFRNPLAEPFTLGVSGGSALGVSVAIALGLGAKFAGIPLTFIASFAGAAAAVVVVYRLASTGQVLLPGALLLAGVVVNFIAGAGVLVIQYVADYTRALQILRWMIGSLDVVGYALLWRMLLFLLPGLAVLFACSRDLHLLAIDEETAASLGVNVRRRERLVYAASSLVVGVTVAASGPIGFVGLTVPHAVRLLFGEDVRMVLPCSFVLGAAFLILADTVARTALGATELPVGAITALAGGPLFLYLLRARRRYSAL